MKIKDLSELLNGYAFKSSNYINTGHRIIRITNVQSGYLEDEKPVFYAQDDKLNKYELKENDILISLTGNVGRCAMITNDFLPAYLNQRVCCLRVDTKKVLPKFLFYLLNSKKFEFDCINSSQGIAQLNMSTEWLKEYNLDIPSIEEQRKIINVFDKVYKNIEIRKKQINSFDYLIKSQFVEMFGNKQDGFKYNLIEFNECTDSMLKGPFGSDIKKSLYVPKSDDTYKVYIQINAIQQDESLGNYYISKEYFDSKMHKFELKPKDYIVTCDGTLGKLLRLDNEMERGIISASLLKITLNNKINYKYFEELWKQYMLGELSHDIRNACLTHLPSAKIIGLLMIPLPPIDIQNKYAAIVEQIDKQKFVCKKIRQLLCKIIILC